MTVADDIQQRIDAISWYHEFDFPGGGKARSKSPQVAFHRQLWTFIERTLDQVDFTGKTVLDIGCWDGYWSFYAERRGAARVLATDDATQNWAASKGLMLAKYLFKSSIQTDLDVSVYGLDKLSDTFDIILCLGVYYHLVDPFYAFAQIRHRCHPKTIVIIEGDITQGLRKNASYIDLTDHKLPVFIPSPESLSGMLEAAYLRPRAQHLLLDLSHWRLKHRIGARLEAMTGLQTRLPHRMNRAMAICEPFEGHNGAHMYKPPFGLAAYDDRFKSNASGAKATQTP